MTNLTGILSTRYQSEFESESSPSIYQDTLGASLTGCSLKRKKEMTRIDYMRLHCMIMMKLHNAAGSDSDHTSTHDNT
jgi:hypothetical protein